MKRLLPAALVALSLSTAAQNVGIGNTNPTLGGLVVDQKVGAVNALFGSNTTGVTIESSYPGVGLNTYYNGSRKFISPGYGGLLSLDPTSGKLSLLVSGASGTANAAAALTEALTVTPAGSVGIGINGPAARLHALGNTASLLQLENSTTLNSNVNADLTFKTGNYYTGLIRMRGTATASSNMGFYTNASTSLAALVERMTIADNGNVGIGVTTPFYKLDVDGAINSTGNITTAGNVVVGGTVKIAGGSPAAGKVLTATDQFGNTAWSGPVAFKAYILNDTFLQANNSVYADQYHNIGHYTLDFDYGNNFNPTTGVFTAPVAGAYRVEVQLSIQTATNYSVYPTVRVRRSGSGFGMYYDAGAVSSVRICRLSDVLNLAAGETIRVTTSCLNGFTLNGLTTVPYEPTIVESTFSAHLIR